METTHYNLKGLLCPNAMIKISFINKKRAKRFFSMAAKIMILDPNPEVESHECDLFIRRLRSQSLISFRLALHVPHMEECENHLIKRNFEISTSLVDELLYLALGHYLPIALYVYIPTVECT